MPASCRDSGRVSSIRAGASLPSSREACSFRGLHMSSQPGLDCLRSSFSPLWLIQFICAKNVCPILNLAIVSFYFFVTPRFLTLVVCSNQKSIRNHFIEAASPADHLLLFFFLWLKLLFWNYHICGTACDWAFQVVIFLTHKPPGSLPLSSRAVSLSAPCAHPPTPPAGGATGRCAPEAWRAVSARGGAW